MSAISHTIRARLYRLAFTAARFIAIDLPAITQRRDTRLANTTTMHQHNLRWDPMQSLGGDRNDPAPLRSPRRDEPPAGSADREPEH